MTLITRLQQAEAGSREVDEEVYHYCLECGAAAYECHCAPLGYGEQDDPSKPREQTMSELRECPFCGGAPARDWSDGNYWVECTVCGCLSNDRGSQEDADALWNTRPTGKGELVALEDVERVLSGLLEDALTDSRNPMKVVEAILADIRALPRHNGEVERLREAAVEIADTYGDEASSKADEEFMRGDVMGREKAASRAQAAYEIATRLRAILARKEQP